MINTADLKPSRSPFRLFLYFVFGLMILVLLAEGGYWWWHTKQSAKEPLIGEVDVGGIKRFGGKLEEVGNDYLVVYDPAQDTKEKFFFGPSLAISQTTHFMPKDPFSGGIKLPEVTEPVPWKTLEKNDDVIIFYVETAEEGLVIQRIELVKFKRE